MNSQDLVAVRETAEQAVAEMAEGPLKIKAFEVILGSLLSQTRTQAAPSTLRPVAEVQTDRPSSSLAGRIEILAQEDFFSEPRSLSEIQGKLAEHGWHYPQSNLSTPLIRLVRQRELRRLQLQVGSKKVWKYSLP